MEETIKNRIILVLSILALMFFIGSLKSCGNAYRQKQARDKEMAARLDLEEKISKISQQSSLLEEKMRGVRKEMDETKSELEQNRRALAQERSASQSLKEELNKVTKLKETLEEDLKEALVNDKSSRPRKK
jgi:chromosome segregation ATPase